MTHSISRRLYESESVPGLDHLKCKLASSFDSQWPILDELIYCKAHRRSIKICSFLFLELFGVSPLLEDGLKCGQRTCPSPVDLKINPLYLWDGELWVSDNEMDWFFVWQRATCREPLERTARNSNRSRRRRRRTKKANSHSSIEIASQLKS